MKKTVDLTSVSCVNNQVLFRAVSTHRERKRNEERLNYRQILSLTKRYLRVLPTPEDS